MSQRSERMKAIWADPARRARMMQHRKRTPAAERFAAFLAPPDQNGCIRWTGSQHAAGYGVIHDRGGPRLATHVALERAGKRRPSSAHLACHNCDNPECVNAAHLYWGTHSENMADMQAKGRHWATVKADCKQGHPWTPENTRIGADGRKNCRTCERDRLARRKALRAARNQAATTSEEKE